jgi:omega-hydroxy-beta-dihydromenaquinone-9 sulfotransferase
MSHTTKSVLEGFDQNQEGDTLHFQRKHNLSTKNNPLCGICLPQWIAILRQRSHEIEWTTYWPRLLVISLLACINSLLAIPEWILYNKRIRNATIKPLPVFVLGHPRTGTTLLHSILALDTERFAVCTTFCAGFPSCFLWFEHIGKKLFSSVIDDRRPMDNVPLHFDLPQEDELATNVLSGGISPYMPLFFMKQEQSFRPYYSFSDSATDDEYLPPRELAKARKQWTDSFLYLLRKLTVRASIQNSNVKHEPRLLLKSPVHTARIPLLLSLFPDAQFIYIHRNPYDVFQSAAHMAETTYCYTYMNTPTNDMIQEFIFRQYEILWNRYEDGRELLGQDQLIEVSYEELSDKPYETVKKIYTHFTWNFESIDASLQSELSQIKNFARNQHPNLSLTMKQRINERWGSSFTRLGYSKEATATIN